MAEQGNVALVRATRNIDRGTFRILQGAEGELVSVTGPRGSSSTDTLRLTVIWDWAVAQGDDGDYVPVFGVQVEGIPGDAVIAVRTEPARRIPDVPPSVETPVPTVTSIDPVSMPSKGAVRQLLVNGTNFTPDSIVLFNLTEEPTVYISPTQLSITLVPAGAVDGIYPVSVVGAAEVLSFEFTPAQRDNGPTVTGLSPTTAVMGGAAVTLHVYGTNFTPDTVILFNQGEEPTTYVSDTEVTTLVDPATASGPWTVPVSVVGAAESVDFLFTEA